MVSDDLSVAKTQMDLIAPLQVLRGEILSLLEGWLSDVRQTARMRGYNRRHADALGLALRSLPEDARKAMESLRDDLKAERLLIGRQEYLAMSVAVALAWVGVMAVIARSLPADWSALGWIWAGVVGAGVSGALFSIMLTLSSREIQLDFLRPQNLMDALLRMTIAAMSALLLFALLRGGLIDLTISSVPLGEEFAETPPSFSVLGFLACFFAGFSEKLVRGFVTSADAALPEPQPGTEQSRRAADAAADKMEAEKAAKEAQ